MNIVYGDKGIIKILHKIIYLARLALMDLILYDEAIVDSGDNTAERCNNRGLRKRRRRLQGHLMATQALGGK